MYFQYIIKKYFVKQKNYFTEFDLFYIYKKVPKARFFAFYRLLTSCPYGHKLIKKLFNVDSANLIYL